jgi:hypothetical protein
MDSVLNFLSQYVFGNSYFIVIVGFILIIVEIVSIINYGKKDFQLINSAINFLKKNEKKKQLTKKECDNNLFSWLTRHLDGEIFSDKIEVKKDNNNYYILSSYPSILTKSLPRSPVYYAPTLLTALGILGTFLGIFLGLQEIGIDNLKETDKLLTASTKLLEGMKTAFSTSLAGLGSASIMMVLLAYGGYLRQSKRNKIRKNLSEIAYVESTQKLLSRLDNSPKENTSKSLKDLANNLSFLSNLTPENIAFAIQKAIASEKIAIVEELQTQNSHLRNLTPSNIQQVVRDAIASEKIAILEELQTQNSYLQNFTPIAIANAIQPLVTPIQEELTALKQIQIEQESTIQLLVRELRNELIEPVVQRLDQSAKLTEEASLAVRELKNELGGIAESLAGAVQTIQEFQQDTLVKLQEFAQSLQQILNQFSGDTKGVLQQVAIEINSAVGESIKGMEAQRQAFEISANSAADTFKGIREDLQEALTTQATQQKEMLEGVKISTESILEKTTIAFTQQTETIKNVGKEASELMNQAKENLLETLTNIDDILDQTRITLQEELERFRFEYQASLTEFFTQQNNLLEETLGKQKEGLSEVVNNLQTTFKEEVETRKELGKEVNESLVKIQKAVTTVNNLVNAVGLTSGERFAQLQELAYTIGNEAQKVENTYGKINEKVNHNVEVMGNKFEETITKITEEFNQLSINTNTQINNYLTNASNSYNESFNDADKAMANICSKLNDTSHGLMNVAEYLVASANDLKQNNSSNN